jgi:uncharacterized membrane protein (DUF2068 family)
VERQNRLLPLIATFKIFKACMLFTLAFGLHHLRHGDVQSTLETWIRDIRIDPDDHYIQLLIAKIGGIPARRMHELGIFTFFYGLLFAIEGIGLALKKRWAEYVTVISTITFLPLEIYELVATPHRKWLKALLLLLNIAILVYLVINLRRKKSEPPAEAPAVPSLGVER